jgi:predicted phosphodiesterase
MKAALKYAKSVLRDDQIDFIKNLPEKCSIKVGKLRFLVIHGSPRGINEYVFPGLDSTTIKNIFKGVLEDIILYGHTHLPVVYRVNGQTVINVGSVGRPFTDSPDSCYVIIDYPDLSKKKFEIYHKFIEYDKEVTVKKLMNLPFEGKEKLAQVLLDPNKRFALFGV